MPLKVAINAQIRSWRPGGEATVLLGLVRALGQLSDSDDNYTVIAAPENAGLLRDHAGPNTRVIVKDTGQRADLTTRQRLRRARNWFGRMVAPSMWPEVPLSDGFFESLGCDLIHFAYPDFTITSLPSIFQLYDLQHLHYPEYFIPEEISIREGRFPVACRIANAVVTGSRWSKQDIHATYGTPLSKIYPIWGGPPTANYSGEPTPIAALRGQYDLPEPFILYPAAMRPHKNHLRLLDALAQLRDQHDCRINLICTGSNRHPHAQVIETHIDALNLRDQVRVLGLVPQQDLRGLYAAAQFLVFPSLFEGAGYPPLEAFHAGKAVICSTATSLPEAVGEAALLIDPLDRDGLAAAIKQLADDDTLRADMTARGQARLQAFTWEQTAHTYRALYRRVGRQKLTPDERNLLDNHLEKP